MVATTEAQSASGRTDETYTIGLVRTLIAGRHAPSPRSAGMTTG